MSITVTKKNGETRRRMSPDSPVVSVVMPAYNAERWIAKAIESVLAQTLHQWELIVINDGSSDPFTLSLLEHLERPKTRIV